MGPVKLFLYVLYHRLSEQIIFREYQVSKSLLMVLGTWIGIEVSKNHFTLSYASCALKTLPIRNESIKCSSVSISLTSVKYLL